MSSNSGPGSIPSVIANGTLLGTIPTVLDDLVWFKKGHDGRLMVGVLQQDCSSGVYWEHIEPVELLRSIAVMVDIACELPDLTVEEIDEYLLP